MANKINDKFEEFERDAIRFINSDMFDNNDYDIIARRNIVEQQLNNLRVMKRQENI